MIYVELEIRYSIKFKDLKEDEHEFTVWFPEVLARELVDNKVRKQMEIFINNLALLQGAEEGKFINASAGAKKNSDYSLKHKWYVSSTNKADKVLFGHPTIKPFELVKKHILNVTKVGDVVLDAFCGSGTTCCVCKDIDRNYIGFEINPDIYKVAVDRLNCVDINGQIYMFVR